MFSLTYIYHDCFFFQTEEIGIVFDYWKEPGGSEPIPDFLVSHPIDKPLYICVSHFHKDHFNKDIFKWSKRFKNSTYIVSKDVEKRIRYMLRSDSLYKGEKIDPESIKVLAKGEVYEDDNFYVKAFGSTDTGNSYYIRLDLPKLGIFHAGDLNLWTWRDSSDENEVHEAERKFKKELEYISQSVDAFDIVMFPVDARIGSCYEEGARIFCREFKIKYFFPMHFCLGENEEEERRFKSLACDFSKYAYAGEYIGLTSPGDNFFRKSREKEKIKRLFRE